MALSCNQSRIRAFSLLELLIAVAILSTGIIAVMQAFSYSARITGLSCDIVNAVFLGQDLLQELEFKERKGLLQQGPAEAGGKKEKFEWGYSLNLDQDLNLYRLDLDIKWRRINRQEEINSVTYLKK